MFVRTHLFGVNNLHFTFFPKACICCLSDAAGLKAAISLGENNYTLGVQLTLFSWKWEGVPSIGFTTRKVFYPSTALSTHLWWGKKCCECAGPGSADVQLCPPRPLTPGTICISGQFWPCPLIVLSHFLLFWFHFRLESASEPVSCWSIDLTP